MRWLLKLFVFQDNFLESVQPSRVRRNPTGIPANEVAGRGRLWEGSQMFLKGGLTRALTCSMALAIVSNLAAEDLNSVTATSYRPSNVSIADDGRSHRQTPTVRAIQRASPSVVNLHGQKTVRNTAAMMAGSANVARQVNGMGTGVIVDPRGYAVTNFHVVQDVNEINVTLHDGKTTRADVVASDAASDLAVVKIRGNGPFQTIPQGRSDDLMIGETVIAIGNAFGYVHTSTEGIISALHREIPVNETQQYHDLIQTSAGINPGNSGGPLLNIDGEIVGINVAVRVGAQQIAFAIPIDQVLQTVTTMLLRENNESYRIGMLSEPSSQGGIRVVDLTDGGAAQAGGLKQGDRILKIEDIAVSSPLQYALSVLDAMPGQRLAVEFQRDGDVYETEIATMGRTRSVGDPVAQLAWDVLGVSVRPAGDAYTRRMNQRLQTSYRGGLVVTEVRSGSTADDHGIRKGDMLLGIHSWQTASLSDLAGILEHPEMQRGPKAKFYLVRQDQTLVGNLQLAAQSGTRRR